MIYITKHNSVYFQKKNYDYFETNNYGLGPLPNVIPEILAPFTKPSTVGPTMLTEWIKDE